MARHPRVRDFRGSTAAGLWLPRAPVDGGRLAALLDTWPRRYTAWDRPQPATTCLLEVHDAPGFVPSEEPGPWPASLAQALEVPVAWFWVDVSSDPSVIASSYDAKGARRWRKVGGIEVYRKMVREHARDAPVEVEDFALRPAMDFVVSRWRAAGGPTSRGWVYLPPPPVIPPPPPFAPSHDEETVVAFAGRGERLEALILDALGPKAWAIHRLAPSATLVRLFGALPGLALAPGVRKRLAVPVVLYRLDVKRQVVTWDGGRLDLATAPSTSMQPVPFDWQAILERSEKRGRRRWAFRQVRPDVLVLDGGGRERRATGSVRASPRRRQT
jgi:hypothetical protein